jgi:hypothetical protein
MKYGTFKYGHNILYGTLPVTTNLLWTFIVDWDSDGYYSGENEAIYMVDFHLIRGRDNYIGRSGIEKYRPGEVTATFVNDDNRYDPWNTSSPLYPNILPGKFVRCLVKNGNTGTNYALMRGTITDIQLFTRGASKFCKIIVNDAFQWLANVEIILGKEEDNVFGEIVEAILDEAQVPAEWDYTTNHNGNQILFSWFSGMSALDAIRQLEDAEIGTLRHRADGTIAWSSRTNTPTSTTVILETQILKDIVIKQPWESVVNHCIMRVNPLITHNITTDIWTMEDVPYSFTAGSQPIVRIIEFVHPTLGIPIVADNVEATTTGLTYTGAITPGISLNNVADTALLTIHPPVGSVASTSAITAYSVIGDAIYTTSNFSIEFENSESITKYGRKTVIIESPMMQRETIAKTITQGIVDNLKNPIPLPIIQIENRPTLQYPLELYISAINLQLPSRNLDDTYRIGQIEHEWLQENGQAVRTTYHLEPVLNW